MRRRLLAAVGAWAIGSGLVVAENPAPPTLDTLVGQLGADRFADREAAARALEARGAAAIPALQAAARHPDPEVRQRAAVIVTRLQRSSESAKRLVPKTVALDFTDVPLGTALHRLKTQTGVNLTLDPNRVADPLRPVRIVTGELPAWEAIETFCRAAGLRETFTAEIDLPKPDRPRRGYGAPVPPPPLVGNVPVMLVDGKADPLPGDRSTKLRVLALPGSFPTNRVYLGTGEVVLSFDITPLPDLHWQEVVGVRVTRVVDDAGRPGSSAAPRDTPIAGGLSEFPVFVNPRVAMRWDFDGNPIPPAWHANPRVVPVPLRIATPGARTLKHLEGVVVGDVAVQSQELLTLADPVAHPGAVVESGGLKLSVLDVKKNDKDKSVVMRVQLEGPSAMVLHRRGRLNPFGPFWPEPPRGPVAGNELRAVDAAGKPVGGAMNLATDISDDGETLTQIFQMTFRTTSPAKFVVVGPRLVTVEVPFKMENVPLP